MNLGRLRFFAGPLTLAFAMMAPSQAVAQNPPPGEIFDLSTSALLPSSKILDTYTLINTSFVGDGKNEFVSFAFRNQPSYFAFDDAAIMAAGSSINLFANPGFEHGVSIGPADLGSSYPDGWGHWTQPVDTSLIGVVASDQYTSGCGVALPHTGSQFWCDGSEVGYDGIYQAIATTKGTTYNISCWLDDNSFSPINDPNIDMLVYAGDEIPVSTTALASSASPPVVADAPEPASLALLAGGLGFLGLALCCRTRKA